MSPLVNQIWMRLYRIFRSWLFAIRHLPMGIGTQQFERFAQKGHQTAQSQHHTREQALQTRRSIGPGCKYAAFPLNALAQTRQCIHKKSNCQPAPWHAHPPSAHAKPNIVLSQIGHQSSRRIAPIKDQHIIRPQARQRLKQHLALSVIGTMTLACSVNSAPGRYKANKH